MKLTENKDRLENISTDGQTKGQTRFPPHFATKEHDHRCKEVHMHKTHTPTFPPRYYILKQAKEFNAILSQLPITSGSRPMSSVSVKVQNRTYTPILSFLT